MKLNKDKFDHIIDSLEDSNITVTSVLVREDLYADLVNELGAEVSDEGYEYQRIILIPTEDASTDYSFTCVRG